MTPQQLTDQLKQIVLEIKDLADHTAPIVAGKTAVDFFADNFRRQGFLNQAVVPWPDVLRRTKPRNTPKGQTAAGWPILHNTRNLARSINKEISKGKVIVYSDVSYAPYHNEGTAKLPKRQFIGDSGQLNKLIIAEIDRKLKQIPKRQ